MYQKADDMSDSLPKKHFRIFTNEELKEKQYSVQNENTFRQDKKVNHVFKEFLREAGTSSKEYTLFEEPELNDWLKKFWFAARKKRKDSEDGQYSVNSLQYKTVFKVSNTDLTVLKKMGHEYDITKGPSFQGAMDVFKDACTEL